MRNAENVVTAYKQLYGWNTRNTSVWLPSCSELVGTSGTQHATRGVFLSAMQGLNTSADYWVDTKGGTQFAYFLQYNTSGGGQKIMDACNQQMSWLRTCTMDTQTYTWRLTNAQRFDWGLLTDTYAVHPAVEDDLGKALKTINKKAPLWELPVKAPIRPARSETCETR